LSRPFPWRIPASWELPRKRGKGLQSRLPSLHRLDSNQRHGLTLDRWLMFLTAGEIKPRTKNPSTKRCGKNKGKSCRKSPIEGGALEQRPSTPGRKRDGDSAPVSGSWLRKEEKGEGKTEPNYVVHILKSVGHILW
jgi:hypothetical protein